MTASDNTALNDFCVLASSPDCVKVLNEVGEILFFNEDGLRVMEIDHFDHVRNVYWPELWPANVRELAEEGLAVAKFKGVASIKAPCPTAKGNLKWWDVTIAAIPGPATTYTVISRDITEQHAQEVAERARLERLQDIYNSNTDVLWDIDLTADLVWWSEGLQHLFGFEQDQIGKNLLWRQTHIHPDDRSRVISSMADAIENGSTFWEAEFRFRAADGSYIAVLDRGSIMRNLSGMGVRVIGMMQDVSTRHYKTEKNELIAKELSHRVNNILTIVYALFHQSLKKSETLEALSASFGDRLSAMAKANKAIMRSSSDSVDTLALVAEQLAPFIGESRIRVCGPSASVDAVTALPLALVINELATNALKYGALSNDTGDVTINWSLHSEKSLIILDWIERGGPAVQAPIRKGLGSVLIQQSIPGSTVNTRFDPTGFSCSIEIPCE
ncbi:HWE histidine kinase domain-containing protein [Pseudomonas sp. SIMBA_077]